MKRYPFLVLFTIAFICLAPFMWYKTAAGSDFSLTGSLGVESPDPDEEIDEEARLASGVLLPQESFRSYGVGLNAEAIRKANEPPTYIRVDLSYFDDALFIGDSRMVGLAEYGNLGNADVFAKTGLSTAGLFSAKNEESDAHETLEQKLSSKKYGKIYFMLGINELGSNFSTLESRFRKSIERIHDLQPDALLYLCSNLHVSASRSARDKTFNNTNINRLNALLAQIADENHYLYIDVNGVFDVDGALPQEITWDDIHILGKYYAQWSDYFLNYGVESGIIKPSENTAEEETQPKEETTSEETVSKETAPEETPVEEIPTEEMPAEETTPESAESTEGENP